MNTALELVAVCDALRLEVSGGPFTAYTSCAIHCNLIFLGKIHYDNEVPKLMRGLSIVTALSTIEGFGLPVLEAMASGCAVVASRTGAWEDIIEENVHGKLVPCNDTIYSSELSS